MDATICLAQNSEHALAYEFQQQVFTVMVEAIIQLTVPLNEMFILNGNQCNKQMT